VDRGLGHAEPPKQLDRALATGRRERRVPDEMRDLGQRPVPVTVRLRVALMPVVVLVLIGMMVMTVIVVVLVAMTVVVVLVMAVSRLAGMPVVGVVTRAGHQSDMRRVDPGAQNPRRRQIVSDAKTAQRSLQLRQRQPGIEQRAKDHVPGRSGKTVEVHHPSHESHPDSFIEQ
jgi:hypothetical protein